MEELGQLARSAGASVVGNVIQEKARLDPATLIGSGKVVEITRLAEEADADVLLFDHDLSPVQQRNLEAAVGRKTLDRTQLILDIFARRARTREAGCRWSWRSSTTCCRAWPARALLSRLGGGIGTRGPARPSWRPTAGASASASSRSSARSSASAAPVARASAGAPGPRRRWSRSWATRTRGSPRCSPR